MRSNRYEGQQVMGSGVPYAVLEERMQGFDRDLTDLGRSVDAKIEGVSAQISALASKFDDRSKIQWPAVGAVITAIGLIGGVLWYPISNEQRRTDSQLQTLSARVDSGNASVLGQLDLTRREFSLTLDRGRERLQADYVPQRELDARLSSAAQRRDDVQRLTDNRLSRLDSDYNSLQTALVPRGEHEEKWRSQGLRDQDMQRQIDQMRQTYSELYSPKDALQNMYRRIEDLERRLRAPSS